MAGEWGCCGCCHAQRGAGGWWLLRSGAGSVESGGGVVRLCVGPSPPYCFSYVEASSSAPGEPGLRGGVFEARLRLSLLHSGGAGWGFWNRSLSLEGFYPVWFLHLNTPSTSYPLRGLWVQVGNRLTPVTLYPGTPRRKLVFRRLTGLGVGELRLARAKPLLPGFDPVQLHSYRVEWRNGRARFYIDGRLVSDQPARHVEATAVLWIGNTILTGDRGDPGRVYRYTPVELGEKACLEIHGGRG